ncbi:MAG: putative glycoside hydrolase [Eubacteriales bacterium]
MIKKTILILISMILIISTGCSNNDEEPNPGEENTTPPALENGEEEPEEPEEEQPTEEELAQMAYDEYLEELETLENDRTETLGKFYIKLPELSFEEFKNKDEPKEKVEAKGLFFTGSSAGMGLDDEDIQNYAAYVKALGEGDQGKINELLPLIDGVNRFERAVALAIETEVNAFVIDVKDDSGFMTYESSLEIVEEVNGNRGVRIKDVEGMLQTLKKYDIYTIARIVTFKDENFAVQKPDHSIQLKNGGVWKDYSGTSWVNPFDEYVWDYNIAIAREAALKGFDEIQFDYVRFPDNAIVYNPITHFPGRNDREKDEAIGDFLKYAEKELVDYNVFTAADVFGLITKGWDDFPEDIGQSWIEMAPYVDYMCPMVYPSHYGEWWYGYEAPDAHPYGVLKGSMEEALEKNAAIENDSLIRPWIQGFTAGWVEGHIYYSPSKIRDQILASKELGIDEYLIWAPGNTYDPRIFFPSEEEKATTYPLETGDKDLVGRTPADAVYEYLSAERNDTISMVYLLTPIDDRVQNFKEFYKNYKSLGFELSDYEVMEYDIYDENKANVNLSYQYKILGEEVEEEKFIEATDTSWQTIKEKGVWKVKSEIESEIETFKNTAVE